MALSKVLESDSGHEVSYHRIHSVWLEDGAISLEVRSYKDASARAAGKPPGKSSTYIINRADVDMEESLLVELYGQLKNLEQFSDSEDC